MSETAEKLRNIEEQLLTELVDVCDVKEDVLTQSWDEVACSLGHLADERNCKKLLAASMIYQGMSELWLACQETEDLW